MIVNVLRFTFRPEATEEDKERVLTAMRRTASVDSTEWGTVGQALSDPDGYTHVYCAAVKDLAALERYLHDPVHLAGDYEIAPHLQRLTAVRVSDDMDPGLTEKVMTMAGRKLGMYPVWAKAFTAIPELRMAAGD
ncbi:Dabb family protein [Kibdelosporangium lantanae]|uniref:Dabb family protein n=1 Tax=Kibdelosporangium lantanae TaxID=1497396 RepID=A0ABW3M508_9PSEU